MWGGRDHLWNGLCVEGGRRDARLGRSTVVFRRFAWIFRLDLILSRKHGYISAVNKHGQFYLTLEKYTQF